MKINLCLLLLIPFFAGSQTFKLTVHNGYGSDTYPSGDTIHVFAREEKPTETFETWTGDTAFLDDPSEWHTTLKMPAKNVSITARFKSLPPGAKLTFERMRGRDTLKPVYYYFPTKGQPLKALVWIYHGTGGSYRSFAEKPEGLSIIKALVADQYAVAMTECDEATFLMDFNHDGNSRWDYTFSPATGKVSADMINQQMIRDTFVKRGYMSNNLPEISLGFSAGGAFSVLNGWFMGLQRGVTYCSQGTFLAAERSTMPTMFFQSFNDNHPDIGKPGNDTAYQNYSNMVSRGICAQFNMFNPWPCYPEYFRRIPGIDSSKSLNIFNELKTMNALTSKNYGRLRPDQIVQVVLAQPAKYPTLTSLTTNQLEDLDDLLQILLTFHHYHSHFNGKLLRFYNETCGKITTPYKDIRAHSSFTVFPNPTRERVHIKLQEISDQHIEICLFNLEGKLILSMDTDASKNDVFSVDLQGVPSGIFLLAIRGDRGYRKMEKVEIQ